MEPAGHAELTETSEVTRALGNYLRRMRNLRGWTRPTLCKMASMKLTTYAGYEQGLRPIPLNVLVAVARMYDMKPGAILDAALEDSAFTEPPVVSRSEFVELERRVAALEERQNADGRAYLQGAL
jgi:transcriptional regulator with XRE-family HTH domain